MLLARILAAPLQEDDGAPVFLGEDILAYLVLALGGALFVGNLLAVVRPPERPTGDDLAEAPVVRSIVMGGLGFVASVWAIASLVAG